MKFEITVQPYCTDFCRMPFGKLPAICHNLPRQFAAMAKIARTAGFARIAEIAGIAGIARITKIAGIYRIL